MCAVSLLLLWLALCLQPTTSAGGDEDVIDPFQLARELRDDICHIDIYQAEDFYRELRENNSRNFSYPDPSKEQSDSSRPMVFFVTFQPLPPIHT